MKGAVLFKYNEPLVIRDDIKIDKPKSEEVKLKIVATGLCHSDVSAFKGLTPVPTPFIAGHEIAGIVEEVGDNVTTFKPGDRVVASWVYSCGKCKNCIAGKENLCEVAGKYRIAGTLLDGTTRLHFKDGSLVRMFGGGGFAEYAIIPYTALAKVPEDVDLKKVAVLGCAGLTAYGAVVNSAKVEAGENVVVIGAGGVGLSIVQMLRVVGAGRIIVIDIVNQKLEKALDLGATDIVNSKETDAIKFVKDVTGGGADVVIEAVGNVATEKMTLEIVRSGGRIIFVGLPSVNEETPIRISSVIRGGIQIIGSYGGRPRVDLPRLIELVRRGKYDPNALITGEFKLEEINEAVKLLEKGEAIRSLIVPS